MGFRNGNAFSYLSNKKNGSVIICYSGVNDVIDVDLKKNTILNFAYKLLLNAWVQV